MIGRREPYTQIGIRRLKCIRCGEQAVHQWQICSLRNRWVPICVDCDISLNATVLEFMEIPDAERILAVYIEKQTTENPE